MAEGEKVFEISSDWACNAIGESEVFGPPSERKVALASLERTRGLPAEERAIRAFRDVFRVNRICRTVVLADTRRMTFTRQFISGQ